ncbi:histone deacetylase [Streptomyces sp. NPDC018610]|uniref:histone deacetylase n=1 Tax=Streptomyces sp. NPDC018610 TaxID=3365049 RepID=UPI00379230B6
MFTPRQLDGLATEPTSPRQVWYAAFGSNMHLARLTYYLLGGKPPNGRRTYPGCRDGSPPERMEPVLLPGELYFALESQAWTGGMGFYDPNVGDQMAARAYLVTAEQFSDIAAQEMYREPGVKLDLSKVLATGRAEMGPGRYETLVCPGYLDGHPVLTFTAPWEIGEVELKPPSANYLRHLGSGLAEAHGWPVERIADYLATRPGAVGHWTPDSVADLLGPYGVGESA